MIDKHKFNRAYSAAMTTYKLETRRLAWVKASEVLDATTPTGQAFDAYSAAFDAAEAARLAYYVACDAARDAAHDEAVS
jgi:hypothetical protein